jgi:Fur family transcriptional regulator, ferric uptake regulator
MTRAKVAASAGELREQMRARGLRPTAARVAVLQSLQNVTTPISHGDLAASLAPGGWDRATVYRNLVDLTEAGFIRRTDLGDHLWRFELLSEQGSHGDEHPHFMCEACGEVTCLPGESVLIHASQDAPRALRQKKLEIQLKGRCDNCE